ncbi:hypothetical protein MKQ70_17540 [Chitinophaga sedimenti]|uniref:hypothetical protein n=1 Tax=Chitinophaga sedimenti TaxID=2033606 RepID=UPI00200674CC|nr:hypothetical protein [Chitinophaga sedimenti]MCK7556724.1 hypothetical protein [Chitinophaga sedimenti]
MYLRDELNYKTDMKYYMFGPVHPWNRSGDRTAENLRQAMAQNPYLHLLVQSGYYDGACDYFNAKYNLWQMDPSGKLKDRMSWEGYRSGHMMYLRKDDLVSSNENLRNFIKRRSRNREHLRNIKIKKPGCRGFFILEISFQTQPLRPALPWL